MFTGWVVNNNKTRGFTIWNNKKSSWQPITRWFSFFIETPSASAHFEPNFWLRWKKWSPWAQAELVLNRWFQTTFLYILGHTHLSPQHQDDVPCLFRRVWGSLWLKPSCSIVILGGETHFPNYTWWIISKNLDLFKATFYFVYHGIHHHEKPSFGIIFLEPFSKHRKQTKLWHPKKSTLAFFFEGCVLQTNVVFSGPFDITSKSKNRNLCNG